MADARLYVIVGLLGCGKTTLAKMMDCAYLPFDYMWHEVCQRNGIGVPKFVDDLAATLNQKPELDAVIDGWYTWVKDWQYKEVDQSLEALQLLLDHHRITVIRLQLPFLQSAEAHFAKKGKFANYAPSVSTREKCLTERLVEWAK